MLLSPLNYFIFFFLSCRSKSISFLISTFLNKFSSLAAIYTLGIYQNNYRYYDAQILTGIEPYAANHVLKTYRRFWNSKRQHHSFQAAEFCLRYTQIWMQVMRKTRLLSVFYWGLKENNLLNILENIYIQLKFTANSVQDIVLVLLLLFVWILWGEMLFQSRTWTKAKGLQYPNNSYPWPSRSQALLSVPITTHVLFLLLEEPWSVLKL